MKDSVYLVTKDTDLVRHFKNECDKTKITVLPSLSGMGHPESSCPLFLIDSEVPLEREIDTLVKGKKEDGQPFYTIISSAPSLKRTSAHICDIALHLNDSSDAEGGVFNHDTKKGEKNHELHLLKFLEKSVYEFVRKVRHSRPKNLYSLLISEFEKPIFRAALEEMDGNQMRAAELLGMHRNTLRKKIKELKIPIKKRKTEPAQ